MKKRETLRTLPEARLEAPKGGSIIIEDNVLVRDDDSTKAPIIISDLVPIVIQDGVMM